MRDDGSNKRLTRNHWTAIVAIPFAVAALVCFAQSMWWFLVLEHPKWDDFLMLGITWSIAAISAAILFRAALSTMAPEPWLPRWIAATFLVVAVGAGLCILLFFWFASAWGP